MTDPPPASQRTIYLPFSEGEADEILDDLPLGHSVSEATRSLYRRLRDARRNPPQGGPLPHQRYPDGDDIMYAPMQPVRPVPEKEPRAGHGICTRDTSGIYGLGVVCNVFIASDGATAVRWLGGPPQGPPRWEFYDNSGATPFEQLDRHNGAIEVIWLETGTDE